MMQIDLRVKTISVFSVVFTKCCYLCRIRNGDASQNAPHVLRNSAFVMFLRVQPSSLGCCFERYSFFNDFLIVFSTCLAKTTEKYAGNTIFKIIDPDWSILPQISLRVWAATFERYCFFDNIRYCVRAYTYYAVLRTRVVN